jgi:hypothetical protein
VTELQISPQMGLEQAMAEVRAYLEGKQPPSSVSPAPADTASAQFSMQQNFLHRLGDLANRLGQVEPDSKLGAPGVFLKRVVRKLIGWYSRPSQQFDRTTYEALVQIRQDMVRQQQQIALLEGRLTGADRQQQLVQAMLGLFQVLIAVPSVREALAAEDLDLTEKVEDLVNALNGQPDAHSSAQGGKPHA